ncbi:MAG: DUF945 family protein, partial [Gammaproteobacteria bacterium]
LNGMRVPLKGGEFGTIEFAVTDVHRGWWSSSATINLNYIESPLLVAKQENPPSTTEKTPGPATNAKVANPETPKTLLIAKAHLVHGPILWRSGETKAHPFWGQAWFDAPIDYVIDNLPERFLEVTGLETGELMGYVSLLGEQIYYASTNEISFQDTAGQLNFSGFNLEVVRSSSGEKLAFDLAVPHFNFVLYSAEDSKGGVRWLMDNIDVKFMGTVDHPAAFWYGTWYGDAIGSIGAIQVEADGENYALTRLTTTSTQKAGKNNNLLEGKTQLEIENVELNQQIFGPIEASISYSNIDRPALEDIRKLYGDWFAENSGQPFLVSLTPTQREKFYNDLFTLVNQLPVYSLDNLTIGTSSGRVNGDFSIKVTAPAKEVSDLQTLGYWQQSLDANIDVDASQIIAQNVMAWALQQFYDSMNPLFKLPAPESHPGANNPIDYHGEAQSLLKQAQVFGIIKSIDNDYVLGAHYKEGLLTINDRPIFDLSNKSNK